jgi:FeS assembly SUF system protein
MNAALSHEDLDVVTPPSLQESPVENDATNRIKAQMVDFLKTVHDPEIPVNIYDLGLIYRIDLFHDGEKFRAEIDMTLTAPGCPVAGTMPGLVQLAASQADGLSDVKVELVWEPAWDRARMSEAARLELNMF